MDLADPERRPSYPAPGWRSYDECAPSHVICLNGTVASTSCRELAGAFVREVMAERRRNREIAPELPRPPD